MLKNQLLSSKKCQLFVTLHQERGSAIKSSLLSLAQNFAAVAYFERWMVTSDSNRTAMGKGRTKHAGKQLKTFLFSFFYFKLQSMMLHTLMNLYLTRSAEGLKVTENKGNDCIAFSEKKTAQLLTNIYQNNFKQLMALNKDNFSDNRQTNPASFLQLKLAWEGNKLQNIHDRITNRSYALCQRGRHIV